MMKRLITICAIVAMFLCTYASADMTITFDDLATPNTGSGIADWGYVPTSYQGLTWTGWEVLNNGPGGSTYQGVYNNSYGFPSDGRAAYNGGTGNLTVTTQDSTPFTLDELYVSSFVQNNAYQGFSSHYMTVTGYLGATKIGEATYNPLPTNAFALWTPDLGGLVDRIVVTSEGAGKYWLIDDITITPVPVPAAVLLGMLGMGAAGLKLRKYV